MQRRATPRLRPRARPRSAPVSLCERRLGLRLGRRRARRSELPWTAVRVDVGEEEEIRVRLGAIAERPRTDVSEAQGHPSEEEPDEPAEEGDEEEHAVEGAADEERGDRQEEARQRLPTVLALGTVDLDLDRIGARRAYEARERVRDEEDVGVDVHRVLHVGGDEA